MKTNTPHPRASHRFSGRPDARAATNGVALAAALLGLPASPAAAQSAPNLDTLTAAEAARQICARTLSSEALVAAAIARAKASAELNAFVTLDEAGAMKAARAADAARKRGSPCKTLGGVPIVVKDNIHVAGLPSTAGTPALKDFRPKSDAPVVARLRADGAIVIGKTNMHELAFGVSGFNPAFKTGSEPGVRNAYDKARIAGGSSSGTAAAVGARIAPAGLGTDTGGSVRVPCAFNGCAALRPTVGRYPGAGIAPISHTRDTAGPMASSMADVALLDRAIAGGTPVRPASLKSVRLGLLAEGMANTDDDTLAAIEAALAKLKAAGATIVEVKMPRLAELNNAVSFPVALYEAHGDMVRYLRIHKTGVSLADLAAKAASPDVKGTYEGLVIPKKLPGPNNTLVDGRPPYEAALRTGRPALKAYYAETFRKNRLDALVFPTVPKVAIAANPESSSLQNFLAIIQNTDPGSNAALPGLQLPVGLGAASKLPIGIEFDGPSGSDRKLVAIGLAVEAVLGRLPAPAR